jgi:hypothetical protein
MEDLESIGTLLQVVNKENDVLPRPPGLIATAGKHAPITGKGGILERAKEISVDPGTVEAMKPREYVPETASFRDVMFHAVYDTDEETKQRSLNEVMARVEEAEQKGLINRKEIRTTIVDTLETSTWDERDKRAYYYSRLTEKGRGLEVEKQGMSEYNTPRYRGMVEQMFVSVADQVGAQGAVDRIEEEAERMREEIVGEGGEVSEEQIREAVEGWVNDWLDKKLINPRELVDREEIAERAHMVGFPPGMNLAESVGKRPEDRGKVYKRLRDEGAEGEAIKKAESAKKLREELKEELDRRRSYAEQGLAQPPPKEFVATFKQSRYGIYEAVWADKVEFLDIHKKEDREKWILLNMEAFNNGIIASPHGQWKGLLDHWLGTLADTIRLEKGQEVEVDEEGMEETKKNMIAMMAVSAPARAMEQTAGVANVYTAYMTQSLPDKLDTDKADAWAEFLLAGDPEKYERVVLQNDLVKFYYNRLLEEAGVEVIKEAKKGNSRSEFKLQDNARESKLVKYLKYKNVESYKGGFGKFIKEVLLVDDGKDDMSYSERWSAAKLACDAFLVDKYTRYETQLNHGLDKNTTPKSMQLRPYVGWGGDPFKGVLEPPFLPRRIKGVFSGKDGKILDKAHDGLRPLAFREDWELTEEQREARRIGLIPDYTKMAVQASALEPLKRFNRYFTAWSATFGSSMASGLAEWDKDTANILYKAVAEKLFQVYGDQPWRGDMIGDQVSKIIDAKVYAMVAESKRPGFLKKMERVFGEGSNPFLEIEKQIYGKDLHYSDGLIQKMASSEMRIVFRDNVFGAEDTLTKTWNVLKSNDQQLGNLSQLVFLEILGLIIDYLKASGMVRTPR